MTIISTKIKEIISATPTIKTIRLDLLNNQFEYKAGQWINCYADMDDKREIVGYSIASSPLRQGYIDIAVKNSDNPVTAFLHSDAKAGDTLWIDGGHGDIYFEKGMSNSLVLIAAGIGISPLMGISRFVTDSGIDIKVLLFYGATNPDELIYHEELQEIERTQKYFSYVPLVSNDPKKVWNGYTGRINEEIIKQHSPDPDALYYICGPSPMMDYVIQYLKTQKIHESQLKYEYWW
jgi:ferredoxin-NADP reductase